MNLSSMLLKHIDQKAALLTVTCLAAFLAGCGNSDISKVKAAKLDIDPSFTIEQALDHRKVCESISWDVIKDDRDRTIVEYRCEFKGVSGLVKENIEKTVASLKASAEEQKRFFEQSLKAAENAVVDDKSKMSQVESSESGAIVDSDPDYTHVFQKRVQSLDDQISVLKSGDMNEIAKTDFDMKYGVAPAIRSCAQGVVLRGADLASCNKSWQVDTLAAMTRDRQAAEEAYQQRLQQVQQNGKQEREESLKNATSDLKDAEQAVAQMEAERSSKLSAIDNELDVAIKKAKENPVTKIDEVFQWSVPKDGEPDLLYVGSEVITDDGKTHNHAYGNIQTVEQLIVKNTAENFSQYNREFRSQSYVNFLTD